ncbi:MAG: ribonuclease Y [Candidatus Methylomirabilota bacterium]|nr:MAG: ribonuclease Y [candidate division NC10 bacterium]
MAIGIDQLAIVLIVAVAGVVIGYLLRKQVFESKIAEAESLAKRIVTEAEKEAETKVREAELEAKEHAIQAKADLERETKSRRHEIETAQRQLSQNEETLERRSEQLERRDRELSERARDLGNREQAAVDKETQCAQLIEDAQRQLERISGLTAEEARKILLQNLEQEARVESIALFKRLEDEARTTADAKAKEILTIAVDKCASEFIMESTVSVVDLPNEEMKGRIIGREGRNIRAFERATGIDVIVDDTPEAVILSGFDPIRRAIAKESLQRLITDGRIHPARIEEIVEKVKGEIDDDIKKTGERAAFEVGISGLHPELVRLVGRLKYRTSYSQNQLQHTIEVAQLAGVVAAELGLDVKVAKRAGLLHDIGKSADVNMEGTHVSISAELAKKYGEHPRVVNAIAAHHEDVEATCLEAVILQIADTLSAARPGARRELLETYVKRLEGLERIANSFAGVSKTYAVQAGREVRIIVEGAEVSDVQAYQLARDIAKRIEEELQYPGHIKVTVIRETRAVEYAK